MSAVHQENMWREYVVGRRISIFTECPLCMIEQAEALHNEMLLLLPVRFSNVWEYISCARPYCGKPSTSYWLTHARAGV